MNIYVGNLPYSTTEDQLRMKFGAYGNVTSVRMLTDRDTGRPRGIAFVDMEYGADEAINALNGSNIDGRQIRVNEARPKSSGYSRPREDYGNRDYGNRRDSRRSIDCNNCQSNPCKLIDAIAEMTGPMDVEVKSCPSYSS